MSQVSVEYSGGSVQIRVPMKLKRRNGRKVVILPEGAPSQSVVPRPQCNRSLAATIARAYHWDGLIACGRYSSVSDLAAALRLDRSFVARVLRLTLLAPDIVESILAGDEPSGLTYKDLSAGKFPDMWCEQRKMFGFVSGLQVGEIPRREVDAASNLAVAGVVDVAGVSGYHYTGPQPSGRISNQ